MGERIRSLRERNGLTQSQFSQQTVQADPSGKGISRTVLVGYEAGKFKPGAREIRILCETFKVNASWLIFGDLDQKADDDSFDASLFGGMGDPDLSFAFRVALALAGLKAHERESFATLIHGLAVARRGGPTAKDLFDLADVMAHDAELRLCEVTKSKDAASQLRFYKGKTLFKHFFDLYLEAYKEMFPRGGESKK